MPRASGTLHPTARVSWASRSHRASSPRPGPAVDPGADPSSDAAGVGAGGEQQHARRRRRRGRRSSRRTAPAGRARRRSAPLVHQMLAAPATATPAPCASAEPSERTRPSRASWMPKMATAIDTSTVVPAGVTAAAMADAVIAAVATGPELTTRNEVPVSTTEPMSRATAISTRVAPMATSPNGTATTVSAGGEVRRPQLLRPPPRDRRADRQRQDAGAQPRVDDRGRSRRPHPRRSRGTAGRAPAAACAVATMATAPARAAR